MLNLCRCGKLLRTFLQLPRLYVCCVEQLTSRFCVHFDCRRRRVSLGRLFDRIDLIKPVSNVPPSNRPSVRACVCTSIRPSVHKNPLDFNEIWRVCRGRWVMHDGMQYDPIQGQGQGHEPFKVGNPAVFKSYLLRRLQWELAADHRFLN